MTLKPNVNKMIIVVIPAPTPIRLHPTHLSFLYLTCKLYLATLNRISSTEQLFAWRQMAVSSQKDRRCPPRVTVGSLGTPASLCENKIHTSFIHT